MGAFASILLSLLLLASPAWATYAATVLADSPLSYWKLNEASGTVALDVGSLANNGAFTGAGVTLGQVGPFGCGDTSALFDGTVGAVVIPNRSGYHVATTGQFTVEAFVKYASDQDVHNRGVISKANQQSTDVNEWVMLSPVPASGAVTRWDVLQSTGPDHAIANGTTLGSLTAFQHMVGTVIDGTNIKFYTNGVLEGTSTTFSGTAGSGTTQVTIASFITDTGGGPTAHFLNAYIAQVAIYGTALSAARVLAHYQAAVAQTTTCTPVRVFGSRRMVVQADPSEWFLNPVRIPWLSSTS